MSLGGGGGAAPPAGLSPMQRATFDASREMVFGGNGTQGGFYAARKYGKQFQNLAQGGLLNLGLMQAQQGLNLSAIGPGMMARNAQRYGLAPDATAQQDAAQQAAMTDAAARVAVDSQARLGLNAAMQDMRFGGLQL